MIPLLTPLSEKTAGSLQVGDRILLSGRIYLGRDAVLPRICQLIDEGRLAEFGIDLAGAAIFHSAFSPAGLGPTSSNKLEIESSMPKLARAGVRLHLGKGEIGEETIRALHEHHSVFAVTPPVTALFRQNIRNKRVAAFPELGMEAFYELEVVDFPAIVAAAQNRSIYQGR